MWIKPAAQPTVLVVAKQDRFAQSVMLVCVYWKFKELNHFEFIHDGTVKAAALYSKQFDRVQAALAPRYPALINRKYAFLQHDNAPAVHTAALIKVKIKSLPPELKFFLIPHIALILRRHLTTITCSALWLTSFIYAAAPSILCTSSKMFAVEFFAYKSVWWYRSRVLNNGS